jgi:LmbE family N-acetylglucosaminyl deacetylase
MAEILVVAAHPDDEVLGCGGAIARHVHDGDRVRVVVVGEGITSRAAGQAGQTDEAELAQIRDAAIRANDVLGVSDLVLEGLPDNRLDSLDRLAVTQLIESHIQRWQPSIVYTHHVGDVNLDHQVVHHAVVTACRPQPGHPVDTLLFFEVASSTEWQPPGSGLPFQPNWYVDIADTLAVKLAALNVYGAEMRAWPHPRSLRAVEHLARWRGASAGVEAAEAFGLGRRVLACKN